MKKDIHPDYHPVVYHDGSAGIEFTSRSTQKSNEVRKIDGVDHYVIRVEIDDNRGKTWVVELRDWWFPEPPYSKSWPVRKPSLIQRVKAWYQRLRFGSPYSSLRTAA